MLEDYRTLSWTRLMIINDYEVGQQRKWPLGPDIVEECQAVDELPAVDPDHWTPLFEPTDFNDNHGPLQLEDYRLSQEELKRWAERCTAIRAAIVQRARELVQQEPEEPDQVENVRSRRGRPRSKP